jgi:3-methyl-2-oxobutanoate hydroxymethyltransferase
VSAEAAATPPPAPAKLGLPELGAMKRRGEKLAMVTAYDAPSARLADQAGVELVLVGDTAAMVVLGHASTVPVSLEEMLFLTAAVSRTARRALVIGDLPFGSYEVSDEQAVASAVRMVKEGGADLVKLEGAGRMAQRLRAIAEANIAVVGHVGLTPQSATRLGGFRAQGRTAASALALVDAALSLEEAGAVAIVLEAVPPPVAAAITARVAVPTIGIGAGPDCDGQVLVWHDLLGLYPGPTPRFVRRYAELGVEIEAALRHYVADVRDGSFPEPVHTYSIPEPERARLEAVLDERQRFG